MINLTGTLTLVSSSIDELIALLIAFFDITIRVADVFRAHAPVLFCVKCVYVAACGHVGPSVDRGSSWAHWFNPLPRLGYGQV